VICAPEPHHLEGEHLLAVVARSAESNGQVDLPEGLDALARRDAMERVVLGRSWSNPIPSRRSVCA
jgi:hypothetical protein